jgi:hypothetical protein
MRLKKIVLATRAETDGVISDFNAIMERDGKVTVETLYFITGHYSRNAEDARWGWRENEEFTVTEVFFGYQLKLPEPTQLY